MLRFVPVIEADTRAVTRTFASRLDPRRRTRPPAATNSHSRLLACRRCYLRTRAPVTSFEMTFSCRERAEVGRSLICDG